MLRRHLMLAGLAAGAGLPALQARAQSGSWPTRPVTIVVMFPAGGVADTIARTAATELARVFGQPFVVDNRPGANGQIAAEFVARSAPDGHTLFLASDAAILINPLIYTRLRYDPVKDFMPISQLASTVEALLVSPSVQATNIQQLVALAKAQPGKLNYGSFGVGSNAHLQAEMFKATTGTDLTHVPYKGVAEAVPALLADQVQVLFTSQGQALPHIRSGKIKALAVFSTRRQPTLPDIPTAAEQGLSSMDGGAWFGFMAPAGTSREVIDRLAAESARAIRTDAFKARVVDGLGLEAMGTNPAQFAENLQQGRAKYVAMIRAANIKPEPA
jgi:tripartite-type tricarboxylate transporter receptor subunit TctC